MERNFELMLRSLDEIISVVQPPLPTTKDFLKGVGTFFSKSVTYVHTWTYALDSKNSREIITRIWYT